MACKNCDDCNADIRATCRCCQLVDGDASFKKVCWCELCSAYLCAACRPDMAKRALAFTANIVEKTGQAISSAIGTVKDKVADTLRVRAPKPKIHQTDEFGKEDEEIVKPQGDSSDGTA